MRCLIIFAIRRGGGGGRGRGIGRGVWGWDGDGTDGGVEGWMAELEGRLEVFLEDIRMSGI
jgi:hypothetical protein